ncbi:MAG: hypothetical protein ACTS73_07750 [Arsenophonus sp. NEOnobi-MAG3]
MANFCSSLKELFNFLTINLAASSQWHKSTSLPTVSPKLSGVVHGALYFWNAMAKICPDTQLQPWSY